LICSVALAGVEDEPVFKTIVGLGYKDTSALKGLPYLSMAGGAPLLLSGQQMATQAGMNAWKFVPNWVENMEITGPAMTSDDQMNSNDLSGRLAIVAPSASSLFNMPDLSYYNGAGGFPTGWYIDETTPNTLRFVLKVRNQENGWDVECASVSNCMYGYSRDYTPILYDVTPSNVAEGQEMWFHMNARGAHTDTITPASAAPYRSIHMGQYLMDTEDIIEDADRLSAWTHDMQYAVMTNGAS
jgi:hypothetical protein